MITVARENYNIIRPHIFPKRTMEDENPALCTPLSYIGTPEELDAELGKHPAAYADCHQQLGSTLAHRARKQALAGFEAEVLCKGSDPRGRDSITKLTNIDRSEPDASPFQAPPDYAIEYSRIH